jgi:hypothetical protein
VSRPVLALVWMEQESELASAWVSGTVLELGLALALGSELELELELGLGLELESVLVLVLVLESVLGLELESVWASPLALQTRGVYLSAAASVQELEGASAEGVEQAPMRLEAAARQRRAGRAEVHHWCQSPSTRYPARPFAPEI